MQIKRFDPTIPAMQGRSPAEGAAQQRQFGTLADRLSGFAEQANRRADIQAVNEGTIAGQQAGVGDVSDLELSQEMTLRSEAFNKAAVSSYTAEITTDSKISIAEIEALAPDDINKFDTESSAYIEGVLSELADPQLQAIAGRKMGEYIGVARVRILAKENERDRNIQLANHTMLQSQLKLETFGAVRSGNVDLAEDLVSQYEISVHAAVEGRLMDATAGLKMINDFNESVMMEAHLGNFESALAEDKGFEELQKFIGSKRTGLTEKGRLATIKLMQGRFNDWNKHITAIDRRRETANKVAQTEREAVFTDLMADGMLTREMLNQAHSERKISTSGFKSQTAALAATEEEQKVASDTLIKSDLWNRIYSGEDPEIIRSEMLTKLADRSLDDTDFKSMLGALRSSTLSDITKTPDYKLSLDMIKRQLQTTGPMQAFDTNEQRRISAAMRELFERVEQGEGSLDIVDNIIDRAKPLFSGSAQVIPAIRPRYLIGNDLSESKQGAMDAYSAGSLTWEQFKNQIDSIEQYVEAIEQDKARKEAQEVARKLRESKR